MYLTLVLVLLRPGACHNTEMTKYLQRIQIPCPSHPHPAGGESSLTMGRYRQFTMDVCSTKTNGADASLHMNFSLHGSFSSVILHLLLCEFLHITLWCILGTLRIAMDKSTLLQTPPREGKKSAEVLHFSARQSLYVAETFPLCRSRAFQGRKLTAF